MKTLLFRLKRRFRASAAGKRFVAAVSNTRFGDMLYKTLDAFGLTDTAPSEQGKIEREKAVVFYRDNAGRVERILSQLADGKSRDVFAKIVRYRQTLDKKDRPAFSMYDQYFPKDVVSLSDEEVFVDCGAYTGDTARAFVQRTKGRYKRLVGFETDAALFARIDKTLPRSVFFNKGVWDKADRVAFCADDSYGKIADTSVSSSTVFDRSDRGAQNETVDVVPIDFVAECADATFIKMDIEGAELPALKGAEQTIRRNKPKLAVCIYHSNADTLDIPEYVIGLDMGYKLFVRQHFGTVCETVLYAV